MVATDTPIYALSADERWQALLADARRGTVLSTVMAVFTHAVNLSVEGELFTLLSTGGRPAPGTLITSRAEFADVVVGERAWITPDTIHFEHGGAVSLEGVTYFTTKVGTVELRHPFEVGEPPYSLDPPGAYDAHTIAHAVAILQQPGSFIPATDGTPFAHAVSAQLNTARTHFRDALSEPLDEPNLRLAVAGLIGLGAGLTPSGDDYLVGALSLISQHPLAAHVRAALAAAIQSLLAAPEGADLTTPVSRHFLIAATERAFHADLAEAARVTLVGDRDLDSACAAAAAIGSTSGGDALQGLADAYAALATHTFPANTTGPGSQAPNSKVITMTEQQWPELVATATPDEVRAAIADGADVNATATSEQQRSSAVLIAARAGNLDVLDVLIEAGADIDAQNRIKLNPFLWACINNNLEVARRMVEAGTDLERRTRFDGVGIHPAAEKGYVELTRYLASLPDMNVNYTNLCGWTPLLEAVILRDGGPAQQEIVQILLDADADPNMVDQWGVSPLQHAEKLGFTEIAELLKKAGAA